ncbi:IclR family transcriptional regulator [Aquibium sp. A9E412]|uniref:IclR family transcriptional regulator n=1 Tax=Aquibium sp. A9E412 TaxID=2976767 RepID=UPI0025AF0104|nr:IclR family transcriptional regulator [Aquibium sp. A9E412]MDN2567919.1 IclR family transcriptional regulator [Aquibium sp. A9E412]
MEDGKRYSVRAVERALEVVRSIAMHPSAPTVDEIVASVGLPKTTVFRVLATLTAERFLERDDRLQTYHFGELAALVGARALGDMDVKRVAHPFLDALMRETGETVHLAILSEGAALCVDKIDALRSVRMLSFVGFRDPLHCSGVGKALLAFQPEPERKRLLESIPLARHTERTICHRGALERHLEEIRDSGYALDAGEVEEGLVCAAAPVFDHLGTVAAAISVSGPASRMNGAALGAAIETVVDHARRISRSLGHRHEWSST